MSTAAFLEEISNLNRKVAAQEQRILQLNGRIIELLEANNRYLDRARTAEGELELAKRQLEAQQLEKVRAQNRVEQLEKDILDIEHAHREEMRDAVAENIARREDGL